MDIRILINRFLNGTSTLEEERILEDYFRKVKDIPQELEPYREMFAYFEGEMADDSLLAGDNTLVEHNDIRAAAVWGRRMVVATRCILAVAATAAAVLVVVFRIGSGAGETDAGKATAAKTGQGVVAQNLSADTVAVGTDTLRNVEEGQNATKPARRTLRKYRYKPAPPEVLLAGAMSTAIADSINEEARRLAEAELKKVENEQNYMLNLIMVADIINSADITAVRDDEDLY